MCSKSTFFFSIGYSILIMFLESVLQFIIHSIMSSLYNWLKVIFLIQFYLESLEEFLVNWEEVPVTWDDLLEIVLSISNCSTFAFNIIKSCLVIFSCLEVFLFLLLISFWNSFFHLMKELFGFSIIGPISLVLFLTRQENSYSHCKLFIFI